MDGDASPNDISSKSMISLGHINTDDGHGDRPAVKRDPFLVQAQGGKVQTNKETGSARRGPWICIQIRAARMSTTTSVNEINRASAGCTTRCEVVTWN